jgi:DNA-binding MarR family transcriptional regulator
MPPGGRTPGRSAGLVFRSLSDLAETARVTFGSMSQTVRRLEQLAYVTKSRGTADRRKVLFSLTEPGRVAAAASRRHRQDWLNGRLAGLTPAERDDTLRFAPLLLRIADY